MYVARITRTSLKCSSGSPGIENKEILWGRVQKVRKVEKKTKTVYFNEMDKKIKPGLSSLLPNLEKIFTVECF